MTESELLEHLKQEFAGANIYLVDEIGIYVRRAASPQCRLIELDDGLFHSSSTFASTVERPVGKPHTFSAIEALTRHVRKFLAGQD